MFRYCKILGDACGAADENEEYAVRSVLPVPIFLSSSVSVCLLACCHHFHSSPADQAVLSTLLIVLVEILRWDDEC